MCMRKGMFSLITIVMLFIIASLTPMIELNGNESGSFAPGDGGGDNGDVTVTLIDPSGGESYIAGDEITIRFSNSGLDGEIILELTVDENEFTSIATKTVEASTSSWHDWTVPNSPTTTAQIRISSVSDSTITDISDYFTIRGSTSEPTTGCTDVSANNYDESAEEDDGSCTYDEEVEYVPCSPIGWWDNTTSYDALQTVLYPPPTTIAWVSLIDNNTEVPAVSGDGHDSWVICDDREVVVWDPVALIWNNTTLDYDGDYEVAELTENYTFNGTDVMTLIGMEGTPVAGKEIILESRELDKSSPKIAHGMHQGAMNSIRNIRAGIWISDGTGGVDLQIVEIDSMHDSIHCIVGGTMCSIVDQGDADFMEADFGESIILDTVPPIVASDCDEGNLQPVGVTIGSLSMADVGGHLLIEASGMYTDVGGHLLIEATGIVTGNDPVFFTHGAQCGAQATVVVELGEGVTAYDFVLNRLEHGPGLHDSIANYVDNGDGTMTVVYTYPGLTCEALSYSAESGTEGRDVGGHLLVESTGIVTCDDAVVEVAGPVNGSRSNIMDDECLTDGVDDDCDGIRDADVLLEVGGIDITERDAVVAGAVGGTTFAMSAMYAHWRHKVAAARRAASPGDELYSRGLHNN